MIYYLPGIDCSLGLSVMTPPCHGGKRSSTLLGSAIFNIHVPINLYLLRYPSRFHLQIFQVYIKLMNYSEAHSELPKVEIIKSFSIVEIPYDSVPQTVKNELDEQLRIYRLRCHNPGKDFDTVFKITCDDDIARYAVHFTFEKTDNSLPTKRIYLIDSHDETLLGHAYAVLSLEPENDSQKDQPFVGGTNTRSAYLHKRLATRRLQVLNELCQTAWSHPLRSSDSIVPEARGIWEKLYKKGMVDVWRNDMRGRPMYRFKDEYALPSEAIALPQKKRS